MIKKILLLCISAFCSAQYYGPRYEMPKYSGNYATSYEEKPRPYNFGYDVKGDYGATINHKEESDSYGYKKGTYGYTDGYGVYRQVDYTADDKGFRAIVKTNEPGTANEDPADVRIYSEAKPVKYSSPSAYDKTRATNPAYKKAESEEQYYAQNRLPASPYSRVHSGQVNSELGPYLEPINQNYRLAPGDKFYSRASTYPNPRSNSQMYKSTSYPQTYTQSPIQPTAYSDTYPKTSSQAKVSIYNKPSESTEIKRSYSKPLGSSYPKSLIDKDDSKYQVPKLDIAPNREPTHYKSYTAQHNSQTHSAPQTKSSAYDSAYPKPDGEYPITPGYPISMEHAQHSKEGRKYPKAPVYPQSSTYEASHPKTSSGDTYSITYSKISKEMSEQGKTHYGSQNPVLYSKINGNSRYGDAPCPHHSNHDSNSDSVHYLSNSHSKQEADVPYRSQRYEQRPIQSHQSNIQYFQPMPQVPLYKSDQSAASYESQKSIYCRNCAPY